MTTRDDRAVVTTGFASSSRGQAHTLEGVVATLIVFTSVIFALQMTSVTPLSASTSSQHLENQQEATARGILATAAESGALKRAVLFWNETNNEFHDTSGVGYYTTDPPPNEFGDMLNRSFDSEGIAYNVYLGFLSEGKERQQRRLVYQGRPSDNAVRATWTVPVFENDPLYDDSENPLGTNVSESSSFYAGNATESGLYNVVRVEVVVWRI